MMLGQVDIHMQKNEFGPFVHIYIYIYINSIIDQNVTLETIKFLEGRVDTSLYDLRLDSRFCFFFFLL